MSRPALQQLAPPFCSLSHHWTTFDLKNDSCPAAHLTALATPLQRWVSLRTDAHLVSSTLGCSCYQWMQKISSTGQVGDSPCFDRMHNTIFFEPWMLTQWQHKAGFAHEKARHAAGSAHRQTDTHTPKQEEERAAATEGASTCHAAAKDRLAHCAAVKGPLDGAKKKNESVRWSTV